MNPRHYHNPVKPRSTRIPCPVCHQDTYSPAGIHPQCAIRLSDPPRPKPKPPTLSADQAATTLSADPSTIEAPTASD